MPALVNFPSPEGDSSREAVEALGGYAYQIYESAIAWVTLEEKEKLFLEVAEDFATAASEHLKAYQVKRSTRNLTLNSKHVAAAIDSLVLLQTRNPDYRVKLVFHTTAEVGRERTKNDRIGSSGGIAYWKEVQKGADPAPLRDRLLSLGLEDATKTFVRNLGNDEFVNQLVCRLEWRCGQRSVEDSRNELNSLLIAYGATQNVLPEDCRIAGMTVISKVLEKVIGEQPRSLTREEFHSLFMSSTSVRVSNASMQQLASGLAAKQPTVLIDQEIDRLCGELQIYSFFPEYGANQRARTLAARLVDGDLQRGTPGKRSRALGWCARILYRDSSAENVQLCLDAAIVLDDADEIRVARVLFEERCNLEAAVSKLIGIGSQLSRSAALILICNDRGIERAFEWFAATCTSAADLDDGGQISLLTGLLSEGRWDRAFELIDQVELDEKEPNPVLCQVVAVGLIARTAPEEHRHLLLNDIPFDADRYKLSDRVSDREYRAKAARLMEIVRDRAEAVGLVETMKQAIRFVIWLRLRLPDSESDARQQLRQELKVPHRALSVVNLALRFGVDVSQEEIERAIGRSVAENLGEYCFDSASARLAMILAESDANVVASNLAKHRPGLSRCLNPVQLVLMEVQALCHARRQGDAQRVLAEAGDIGEAERVFAEQFIAEAKGADPIGIRLKQYEDSGRVEDLESLVEAIRAQGDQARLVTFAELLYEQTGELGDGIKFVRCLEETGEYGRLIQFLEDNPDVLAASHEVAVRCCSAQYMSGDLEQAWTTVQQLREAQDGEFLRGLFVQICIASGRWGELVRFAAQEAREEKKRTPEELIKASNLVSRTSVSLSRSLAEAAVAKAPSDANILGAAYLVATNGGWEEEDEVGGWLQRAIECSGESGPIVRGSLEDIVSQVPQWNAHQEEIWRRMQGSEIPVGVAAGALRRRQADLTVAVAMSNRTMPDPRRRGVVPAFHGRRRLGDDNVEKIVIDPSALFTLADLEVLDSALKAFETVYIPFETLPQIYEDKERVAFHQPSRLKNARELVEAVAAGVLKVLAPEPIAQAWCVQEVGHALAKLLSAAEQYSTEAGNQGYVVHPGEASRPDSLGREPASLRHVDGLLTDCVGWVNHLNRRGAISSHEATHARTVLQFRGDTGQREFEVTTVTALFLDTLAIDYFIELQLLRTIRGTGIKLYILREQLDQAKHLLEYEKRTGEVSSAIEMIRSELAARIEAGTIRVTPPHRGESTLDGGNALISALKYIKHVDAMICDDRAINKNLVATNHDATRPILTSIEVLVKMKNVGLLSIQEELHLRHRLRQANYLFLPLTHEDIQFALEQSIIVEGRLIETAEMRSIREYIATISMTDWFQMPSEGDWLSETHTTIRTAIWNQWKNVDSLELAGARSFWLTSMFDLRFWLRFRQFDAQEVEWMRACQLFLLTHSTSDLTEEETDAFLKWLDDRHIAPLKETRPSMFDELVKLCKEVVETTLKQNRTVEWHADVISGFLFSLPRTLSHALLQDSDLMNRSGVSRRRTVRMADPDTHFDQVELHTVVRAALNEAGTVHDLADISGRPWTVSARRDGSLECIGEAETIQLPELRFLAPEREQRVSSIRALGEGVLPSEALAQWLDCVEEGPLGDADVARLHRDVRATPSTVERMLDQAVEEGTINWNEVVPTDRIYISRLVGLPEESETLQNYVERGLKGWFANLPGTCEEERVKKALTVCATPEISVAVAELIEGQVDGAAVLEWVAAQKSPALHVAGLEVFLPRYVSESSLEEPLSNLLQRIMEAQPEDEASAYRFYLDIVIAVSGHLAYNQGLAGNSRFYRTLYSLTQATLIQSRLVPDQIDWVALGQVIRNDKGYAYAMKSLFDLSTTPEWNIKYLSPEIVYQGHLRRIRSAALGIVDALGGTELGACLLGEGENALSSKLLFPMAYVPGPLEEAPGVRGAQPDDLRAAIMEQLGERPVTDANFTGLINASLAFEVSAAQVKVVNEALNAAKVGLTDVTDERRLWSVLDGLAEIAARSADEALASEVMRLCAHFASGTKGALGYANALSIGLTASAAFENHETRFKKFGHLAEVFSFSDLNRREAEEILSTLTTMHLVEPKMFPFISKCIAALSAFGMAATTENEVAEFD